MNTAQLTVIILSNLESIFGMTIGATQRSSQNTGFGIFGQRTGTSNLGWQPFGNLGGRSIENNNFNNISLVNLFRNLGENNPSPLPPSANLFRNIGGDNPPPNNNNSPPEGLDPNV